jgi:hypothetical protein
MHLSLKGSMDRQPLTDRLGDRLLAEYGGAAAAYSLRALNGNGDNVVRMRRASDNDEKDFTAEQIELGEMVNWVNSQTVPPLDIGVETSEGRIPVPEGGTSIGTPAAAYSLRNLSTTYTGNVVDVRRSSDDAVESFTAAEVSDGTLEAWVGAGNDGRVSKWYDQSGNDNHAVQTTPAKQPTIVEDGSLVTGGIDFDGVDDVLILSSFSGGSISQPFSMFVTAKSDVLDDNQKIVSGDDSIFIGTSSSFDGRYNLRGGGTIITGDIISDDSYHLLTGLFNTTDELFLDGTLEISGDSGSSSLTNLYIGEQDNGFNQFDGIIGELIIYDSDQSDNRTAIEANIGETYGITGIPAYDNTVDGFVETWYDQSGNGNDATQSVAASQPKIVDGGSLVVVDETPSIDFDGTDDSLDYIGAIGVGNDVTVYSVLKNIDDSNRKSAFSIGGYTSFPTSSDSATFDCRQDDPNFRYGDGAIDLGAALPVVSYLATARPFLANPTLTVNGSTRTGSANTRTISDDSFLIGRGIAGTTRISGSIKEMIVYSDNANQAGIESNIADQYGITLS